MVKDCPVHGHFEDVMAMDAKFFKHLEESFPGSDIRSHNDEKLHNHGTSTIKYGRGAVLTIDLTNRCNMMCDPCFMDANQVGFVHELSWEDIKTLLDNAISIKPKRQMSVQFSGGEPTMSPHFLDAVRYARKVGYNSVQAATNGIEFAKSPDFAKAAREAGLRYAYLQFDGIGNAANSHRLVGNLFDVKLRAIENLYDAGVDIVPVVTIVNGVNNEQVGRIIQFALDNPKKINFLSFQPVSFTGRDEEITPERRAAQRYTLSHLAHDVKNQMGIGEPMRDWFPISFIGTFTDWADIVHGPTAQWGNLTCGCHPNCGIGMAVMIDKETKEAVPVTAFLNADQLAKDLRQVNDAARGQEARDRRHGARADAELRSVQGADALQDRRPDEEVRQDLRRDRPQLRQGDGRPDDRRHPPAPLGPLELPVHRRDVVPGPVQLRLPPHRALHHPVCHAGRGDLLLRLQHRHRLAEHHREDAHDGHAHQVVRGARPSRDLRRRQEGAAHATDHSLVLDPAAVAAGRQTDLDDAGIAKTAREEKLRARAAAKLVDPETPEDGRALPPARAQGGADAPDPGPRREEEVRRAGSPAQAHDVGPAPFPGNRGWGMRDGNGAAR